MTPTQYIVNPAVYRPVFFFAGSLLLPWAAWLAAAYFSHQPDGGHKGLLTALLLAGLLAPVCLAAGLLWRQPSLRADALLRLRFSGVRKRYWLAAVLLPPLSLVLAQGVSLLFGYSAGQFHISGSPSFTSALISPWLALVLGAVLEELAWHSYGTDALLSRFSLFAASLVFTVYWALWHVPLGLVKGYYHSELVAQGWLYTANFVEGYYHSELVAQGWLYTANFVASMVVFVLLMNWLYLKSGRSIMVALLFHLAANLGNEIFQTHPDSKVIQTGILLLLTVWVLWKERTLFFRRPRHERTD